MLRGYHRGKHQPASARRALKLVRGCQCLSMAVDGCRWISMAVSGWRSWDAVRGTYRRTIAAVPQTDVKNLKARLQYLRTAPRTRLMMAVERTARTQATRLLGFGQSQERERCSFHSDERPRPARRDAARTACKSHQTGPRRLCAWLQLLGVRVGSASWARGLAQSYPCCILSLWSSEVAASGAGDTSEPRDKEPRCSWNSCSHFANPADTMERQTRTDSRASRYVRASTT
jgi:hypothetical protein